MRIAGARINKQAIAGVWVSDIPEMGDLKLHVRALGNPDYRRMQEELVAKAPRSYRVNGRLTPEARDHVRTECLVESVLLGWENLEGDDGRPIEFSKGKARELLFDADYQPLRDAVEWAATVAAEMRDDAQEDDRKNL